MSRYRRDGSSVSERGGRSAGSYTKSRSCRQVWPQPTEQLAKPSTHWPGTPYPVHVATTLSAPHAVVGYTLCTPRTARDPPGPARGAVRQPTYSVRLDLEPMSTFSLMVRRRGTRWAGVARCTGSRSQHWTRRLLRNSSVRDRCCVLLGFSGCWSTWDIFAVYTKGYSTP
jgi:hypothetical protein